MVWFSHDITVNLFPADRFVLKTTASTFLILCRQSPALLFFLSGQTSALLASRIAGHLVLVDIHKISFDFLVKGKVEKDGKSDYNTKREEDRGIVHVLAANLHVMVHASAPCRSFVHLRCHCVREVENLLVFFHLLKFIEIQGLMLIVV